MQIDNEKLQEALDYFDKTVNNVVGQKYEDINGMQLAIHYNEVRNALAYYMRDKEEIE